MILDALFILFLIIAVRRGMAAGLILSLFYLLAFVAGMMLAVRFSDWTAGRFLQKGPAFPFLGFLLVFLSIAGLIRLAGRMIKGFFRIIFPAWLDKLAGALFYILLYSVIFSIILFFLTPLGIPGTATQEQSIFFPFLKEAGPGLLQKIGKIIPFFDNLFLHLQPVLDNKMNLTE